MERLNDEELVLCRTIFHQLSTKEREQCHKIGMKQANIDLFWGFFDHGFWPSIKRKIYIHLIHPFLRVRKNETD